MTALPRLLVALALALWFSVPSVGNDGGENGSGVWVLPRATFVTSATFGVNVTPRLEKTFPSLANDVVMVTSADMGAPVATFVDEVSGVPVSLPVLGNRVRLPKSLLQSLASLSSPNANILIVDAEQMGYVIRVTVDAQTQTATMRLK